MRAVGRIEVGVDLRQNMLNVSLPSGEERIEGRLVELTAPEGVDGEHAVVGV